MSENVKSITEFINQCKKIIPEFNKTRTPNDLKTIANQEANGYISVFLEEYVKFSSQLNSNQLNANFINFFQNTLLVQKFPGCSRAKIEAIQALIADFLNFLSLKKVLKQHLTKNLSLEFEEIPETNTPLNQKLSSLTKQNINAVSSLILNFSALAEVEYIDKEIIDSFVKNIEAFPEKIIVKAIFKLCEEIEDESRFIKVLFVVDNFLKLNTLPAKTIDYLRYNVENERTLFRLLFLYQSFYFAGYKLEKSVLEVLKELDMDSPGVNKLFEKSTNYIRTMELSNLLDQFFQNSYDLLNIDDLIDEIQPINAQSPIFNPQDTIGYNLPRNVKLDLDKHVLQLETIYNSTELKKQFLSAFSEDFSFNSLTKDNIFLFFEAKDLHVKGKNNKALQLINKLLKKNPEFALALILKGEVLCELYQFHYAIKCYLKSLEINPYKFHAYSQLSYTLQIGGYFHSSYILCSHLLKFCPLDFNLYVELAYSAYQLSRPFKQYLQLAGLLEPERLANFLTRFWIREKIKAKDSLDNLNVKEETILELDKMNTDKSNKLIQFLTYYNDDAIHEEDFEDRFNELINNPLYFFPKKVDQTKKNHFIYELATDMATNLLEIINDLVPGAEPFLLSEDFLKFCLEIGKQITEKIIKDKLKIDHRKRTRTLTINVSKSWIENTLKTLTEEPYFLFLQVMLPKEELFELILSTLNELSLECLECSHHCLIYPTEVFRNFKESCSQWENDTGDDDKHEIDAKKLEFEQDFLPILGFFELFLDEKGISQKNINEKIVDILEFLKFLFFNLKQSINDTNIVITEDIIRTFLEKYVLEKKWIQSKTAMERMKRNLNVFLSFLSNELGCLSKSTMKRLKEEIKKISFSY
ncbi:MAG: tetratricopeptide repeat protein [Promethearchaeota archaeon]